MFQSGVVFFILFYFYIPLILAAIGIHILYIFLGLMSALWVRIVIAGTWFLKLQNEVLIHGRYSSHVPLVIYPNCSKMGIFTTLLHHTIILVKRRIKWKRSNKGSDDIEVYSAILALFTPVCWGLFEVSKPKPDLFWHAIKQSAVNVTIGDRFYVDSSPSASSYKSLWFMSLL